MGSDTPFFEGGLSETLTDNRQATFISIPDSIIVSGDPMGECYVYPRHPQSICSYLLIIYLIDCSMCFVLLEFYLSCI